MKKQDFFSLHNNPRNIELAKAIEIVKETATLFAPKDHKLQESSFGGVYIRCERAWGVGCDLQIMFNANIREETTGEDFTALPIRATFTLSWSSTSRSIATALASIRLYRDMTEFAALVESKLESKDIWQIV